ncbi:MAG: hypothetical protein J0H94_12990 [Rhizobiales bacterium]|nr:hypothetical protein [Hyphomicrobiales bacterium]
MSHSTFDDPPAPPLDPAVIKVEQRLRRLMLVGGLTLGIGILAVLGAIVYRISTAGGKALPAAPMEAKVPAGAKLVSTTAGEGRIVLTYEVGGATTLIFIDAGTLKPLGRLDLKPE